MEKKEFLILIEKYLRGNASHEDEQMLLNFYGSFQDTFEWDERTLGAKLQMEEKILSRIHSGIQPVQSKQPVKLWIKIAAAASIVIAIGVGTYCYQSFLPGEDNIMAGQVKSNDFKPGSNKATLTLADGSTIVLTEAENGALAKQSGVEITKTADGKLVYEVASSNHSGGDMAGEGALNTISTPRGGQYQVRLPDGSKVWLNAASKLTYPASFKGRKERIIELNGEAYFEVAKDKEHPFHVRTTAQEVEVLGTHFNINAYKDEPNVKTTLLEGSVRLVSLRLSKTEVLKPGQQATLLDGQIHVENVDTEAAVAWKNGLFSFKRAELKVVMRQIARWYDVEIVYQGDIPETAITGTIGRNLNASQALQIISNLDISFKIEGKKVIISGK